ncbi:hypothetical protein P3W45_001493 [Vairimorpha bombi]|jgi:hypothetical protein
MVLIFLSILLCLHLKKLDGVELKYMHMFPIPANGIHDYNVLMDRFKINNQEEGHWILFNDQDGDIIGHFLYINEKIDTVMTENRYINLNDSVLQREGANPFHLYLDKVEDIQYIDDNNKFSYFFSKSKIKKINKDTFVMEIPKVDILNFLESTLHKILIPLIKDNTLMTVIQCKKLIKNLNILKKDDPFCHILDKKYILILFKNDYSKIKRYLKNIIKMLYTNSVLTYMNIKDMLKQAYIEFINEGIFEEWSDVFTNFNITDDVEKSQYIFMMLLNDTINLLKLSSNPNHEFCIYNFIIRDISIVSTPTILITVDISSLKDVLIDSLIIKCDKNHIVRCSRCLLFAEELCFYLRMTELKARKIKWLRISFLTPKGRFESRELIIKYD